MAEQDKSLKRSALIVTILFLLGGLYVFVKDMAYIEANHGYLILAYTLFCGAFYFFFQSWRIIPASLSVLIMVALLVAIVQKYEWRKDYVEAATPFFLEEYITDYPTFEEYLYVTYHEGENWVGFSRDCAEPAMLGSTTPLECRSLAAIEENYGLNLKNEVNAYFRKMKTTAKRVERGQMKTARQYQVCVENKGCAEIPMLPKGVNAEDIDPNSDAYIEVRKAYWNLIDENKITAPVCNHMKLCRVLVKLGIVDLEDIKL